MIKAVEVFKQNGIKRMEPEMTAAEAREKAQESDGQDF